MKLLFRRVNLYICTSDTLLVSKLQVSIMLNIYKLPKLPKSSKRLILAISEYGSLTQKQLIAKVKMPAKTVRYALKKLTEENLIVSQHNLEDMRSMFYNLNPDIDFGIMDQHIQDARILVEAEVA